MAGDRRAERARSPGGGWGAGWRSPDRPGGSGRLAGLVLAAAAGLAGPRAPADVVLLQSGAEITGKVLSRDSAGLTIDAVVHGVRATLRFELPAIREVRLGELPEGFFPAGAGAKSGAPGPAASRPPAAAAAPGPLPPGLPLGLSGLQPSPGYALDQVGSAKLQTDAEAGQGEAQLELARRLEVGQGAAPDLAQAQRWLLRAAEGGLPEAQYRLGLALRGTAAPAEERARGLAWLIKAGKAGHLGSCRALAELYERGTGVPKDEAAARRWLRALIELGDVQAHARLAQLDPLGYRQLARDVRYGPRGLLGMTAPGRFEGTLQSAGDGGWTVSGAQRTLRIDPGIAPRELAKVGRRISVFGPVQNGTLLALLADIPEPRYEYTAGLESQPVIAGTAQTWRVVVKVRNTGEQPIKRLSFRVRCYQVSPPNDEEQEVVVRDLEPGEPGEATARFVLYNYQYLGATSTPRSEVVVGQLEW